MTPDRSAEVERPTQKPIYRLIKIEQEKLPAHFRNNRVEGGRVVEDTDEGRVKMSIVALPPEDIQSSLGRFWRKVKAALGAKRTQVTELPTTPVVASPQLYADVYKPGQHVQLMAHMPFVVLEDGTRYGIDVSVPAGLQGQWEDFEAPANDGDFIGLSNKIEIGRRRRGLAVVIRTDDGQPLIRKDLGTTKFQSFQEMLSGRFQPVESDPLREQLLVDKRTTVKKGSSLGVGEERQDQSTEEALLFSALGANEGVGTVDDKKGGIEVIVYEVVEKEVSEIIDTPMPSLVETRDSFGSLFGGKGMGGGFSAGETSFGKGTRQKVDIQGVRVERVLAAFQVVLVGELPEQGMEMVTTE